MLGTTQYIEHSNISLHEFTPHNTCSLHACNFVNDMFEIHVYDAKLKLSTMGGLSNLNIYTYNITCNDTLQESQYMFGDAIITQTEQVVQAPKSCTIDRLMQYAATNDYQFIQELLATERTKLNIYNVTDTCKAPTIVNSLLKYRDLLNGKKLGNMHAVYVNIMHDCYYLCAQSTIVYDADILHVHNDDIIHTLQQHVVKCAEAIRGRQKDAFITHKLVHITTQEFSVSATPLLVHNTTQILQSTNIDTNLLSHIGTQYTASSVAIYIAVAAVAPVTLLCFCAVFIWRSSSTIAQRIRERIMHMLQSAHETKKPQTYDYVEQPLEYELMSV